jgi:hypothetical protein
LRGGSVGSTDQKDFMKYAVEMASGDMICIPTLKIGSGIQVILRLYFNKLRSWSVDVTDGRDL